MKQDISSEPFPIVGIGASAGGLEALRETLSGFSGLPDMAFVIVQHLDPTHESMMAQLIERYTSMPVKQIEGGEKVAKDHVYVIPPGYALTIEDGVLQLGQFESPRGMRRPIDDFFESLAQDQAGLAACVILSGTGADGSRGLRAVKELGGLALAQDPDSARYDGMPLAAVGTGLVDFVKEPQHIIPCLRAFFERRSDGDDTVDDAAFVADHIDELCSSLREIVGHDFSGYKRTTLSRRIQRRMHVLGIDDGGEYLARIKADKDECHALFRDLLINVTRFFRDPEAFELLNARCIEPLVKNAREGEELRVWVPGCSSGEEAYSIAMLFRAAMAKFRTRPVVSIFATDIDEQMLQIARNASYPVAYLADIPETMRSDYTVGHGDSFAIAEPVREMVRFSAHSVIKDPPFSKIDLISCRNLLIYFDDRLQQSVLPLFHYSLRDGGHLLLGPSETIGQFDDLFHAEDQRFRLFKRSAAPPRYPLNLPAPAKRQKQRNRGKSDGERVPNWIEGEALKRAQAYSPATMLVDSQGMLISSWGRVGRYLDFPSDRERRLYAPTLAKSGLREVMGSLIRQTAVAARKHVAKDVDIQTDFGEQPVTVICEPVSDGTFLVVIRETGGFIARDDDDFAELAAADDQVHLLEDELRVTRHRLRSTVEELETTNEELKSSNEEMMSMNEELQSTNEELTTVNDELKSKIDQLTVANADLKNFFDSTQLAVIVLDDELRIRSYTDASKELFPFQPTDKGRSLTEVTSNLSDRSYIDYARNVADGGKPVDERVYDHDTKRCFALRIIPYRRLDGKLDGATMVFTDITKPLSLEQELNDQRQKLQLAMQVAGIGIWEYDPVTGQTVLDETERYLFDVAELDARNIEPLLNRIHQDDRPLVDASLQRALAEDVDYDQAFRVKLSDGEYRWLRGLGRVSGNDGERKFLGVSYDITAERELVQQRDLLLREMNHRIRNLFTVIGSIVAISRREAQTLDDLVNDLSGRIQAMNRAHSLTLEFDRNGPVDLGAVVETVTKPTSAGQTIDISGPPVTIPEMQITPLSLILHEWATNAAKYGALSSQDGKLQVYWTVQDNMICLEWQETVTRAIEDKGSGGFGTRLVEASVMQLKAELSGTQGVGFFRRKITIPAAL